MPLRVAPPAVLVAAAQTSCGIGMRMKVPGGVSCWRIAGGPNVPDHENDPLVVFRVIRMPSTPPSVELHWMSGASRPRGKTVWSYG